MPRVAVVSDTTAYFPTEVAEANGIRIVSLYVNFGGERTEREADIADYDVFYDELKMWFAIDTLEFLKRGGRIGAASAWIGSTLKIKPILSVESEITPVERVRTSARAFERMVDYARQREESGADAWVVQHIQAPDQAIQLTERCRE